MTTNRRGINTDIEILTPNIGQSLAKNRVTSDESCFKMDTVVRREVKKTFYMLLISENSEAFCKYSKHILLFMLV